MENAAKKKLIMVAVIAAIILLAVAVFFLVWKGLPSPGPLGSATGKATQVGGSMKDNLGADAAQETQKLIDEVKQIAEDIDKVGADQKFSQVVTFTRSDTSGTTTSTSTEQAIIVAPESNPISMKTGDVLTVSGDGEAKNNTIAGDASAPLQSAPVDPSKLPESTVKIAISATGCNPKTFTVKPKQAVALSVTAEGTIVIFKFDDPSLSAVAMGLKPGETRVITFNAPGKVGEYKFYSDFAGHRSTGAEGVMIVK